MNEQDTKITILAKGKELSLGIGKYNQGGACYPISGKDECLREVSRALDQHFKDNEQEPKQKLTFSLEQINYLQMNGYLSEEGKDFCLRIMGKSIKETKDKEEVKENE